MQTFLSYLFVIDVVCYPILVSRDAPVYTTLRIQSGPSLCYELSFGISLPRLVVKVVKNFMCDERKVNNFFIFLFILFIYFY